MFFYEIPIAQNLNFYSISEAAYLWREYSSDEVKDALKKLFTTGYVNGSLQSDKGYHRPLTDIIHIDNILVFIGFICSRSQVKFKSPLLYLPNYSFYSADILDDIAIAPSPLTYSSIVNNIEDFGNVAKDVYWLIVKTFLYKSIHVIM